ncbi:MAG: hypothetical protein FD127_4173, partial [Acidimicrobiaceae bacterium]
FRHFVLALTLGASFCVVAAGQTPGTRLTGVLAEAVSDGEVSAAWSDLWAMSVDPEETWLLRAVPGGTGDDTLVLNSSALPGRLGVVHELPLSGPDGRTAATLDLLCSLEACGFTTYAVGAIVETGRGCVAMVALDVRDSTGSLLIPYAITTEAGLFEATDGLRSALQRDDDFPIADSAAQDCNAPGLTCPEVCACKKANCIEEADTNLDDCEGDCWVGLGITGSLAVGAALAATTVTFGTSLLLVSGPVANALHCFKKCDDKHKKDKKKCDDAFTDCMAGCEQK